MVGDLADAHGEQHGLTYFAAHQVAELEADPLIGGGPHLKPVVLHGVDNRAGAG